MDTIPSPITPELNLTLEHTTYFIKPGELTEVNANIENTGDNEIYVEFSISGIDNDWIRSRPTIIKLTQKSRHPLKFSIQPPVNCKTGRYSVIVQASSQPPAPI